MTTLLDLLWYVIGFCCAWVAFDRIRSHFTDPQRGLKSARGAPIEAWELPWYWQTSFAGCIGLLAFLFWMAELLFR